jgi:hypothetical protein
VRPALSAYQVKLPPTALEGRGIGRTTGRMWVWRPVRFRVVMASFSSAGGVRV